MRVKIALDPLAQERQRMAVAERRPRPGSVTSTAPAAGASRRRPRAGVELRFDLLLERVGELAEARALVGRRGAERLQQRRRRGRPCGRGSGRGRRADRPRSPPRRDRARTGRGGNRSDDSDMRRLERFKARGPWSWRSRYGEPARTFRPGRTRTYARRCGGRAWPSAARPWRPPRAARLAGAGLASAAALASVANAAGDVTARSASSCGRSGCPRPSGRRSAGRRSARSRARRR